MHEYLQFLHKEEIHSRQYMKILAERKEQTKKYGRPVRSVELCHSRKDENNREQ